jgi:hypothetical protein
VPGVFLVEMLPERDNSMSLAEKPTEGQLKSEEFPAEVLDAIPMIEELTREIFGPHFSSAFAEDWEIAGDKYVEFRVVDEDDVLANVLARNDRWHRRVAELPAGVRSFFRLSIESGE